MFLINNCPTIYILNQYCALLYDNTLENNIYFQIIYFIQNF